jgi:carboxylesterase type B
MLPEGSDPEYGVHHAIDIPFVFGTMDTPSSSLSDGLNYTGQQRRTSQFMARSWIAFVNDLDPTGTGLDHSYPQWPKYNDETSNMVFDDQPYLEKDDYREDGIRYINEHLLRFAA